MKHELNAVFIMDADQYRYYEQMAEGVEQVAIIDEWGRYPLADGDCDYYVVEVNVEARLSSKTELVRFLATAFKFICLRIEGTTGVFVSSEADLNDLYEDFYKHRGNGKSLQKDLLTTKERYNLIFQSNSYWNLFTTLCLMYTDELDSDMILIDLDETTPELFSIEDEVVVVEELSGETHTIDLTVGIPDNFLTFNVLKKLEKPYENIL